MPFHQKKKTIHSLALLCGMAVLLSSCGLVASEPSSIVETPTPTAEAMPMKAQVFEGFSQGMKLEFDTLDLLIPANANRKENLIDLSSATGQIRMAKPSLHGFSLSLDAPFSYNGLQRELSVTLNDEDLYFSLSADRSSNVNYDVKYHASISAIDNDEIDDTTHGISYYEYGDLDYVIAEILTILGVDEISLNSDKGTGITFDWDAINDSVDAISEFDATRFLWELPIGENVYRIGLTHEGDGVLSGIEFPLLESADSFASLNEDFQLKLRANILHDEELSWSPRYDEEEYTDIIDSLALFRQISKLTQKKAFGLDAHFNLSHTEDEVIGDESHFAKDPVDEAAYLDLEGEVDLSKSFFGGINAEAKIGQVGGSEKTITIHSRDGAEEGIANIFLNVNDILKVRTSSDILDALVQSITDALSDESIQNEMIMKLLSSLLSTANGISEAINAIKDSAFYENINRKHFEDILATIVDFTVKENHISITVDLSPASLIGNATIELYGTADNMSLGKVTLDHVGIKSTNDSKTSFAIDGALEITPYQEIDFDESGYAELTHLPTWTEKIKAIAESDQLSAKLDGYALKVGTTSKISSATAQNYVYDTVQKKGRTEQGMAFHGSLAFDLKNRLGTGEMTFLDLKENYVNDHVLKIDVTGEEGENDTDANDFTGNGNQNAMIFSYDSTNVTAVKGSSAFTSENREDPDFDALAGRFSIHSLNGVLDVLLELTDSTDPRFARLTNLVSSLSAETLLTKLLSGEYFELLTSKILVSADIGTNSSTFVIAPGIVQQNSGLTLRLGYDNDGAPTTIEVWITLDGEENDTDVYAKITLQSTSFSSFPFQFSDHNLGSYTNYSSIKTLLEFLLGTITLGVTDTSSVTTYHLSGLIDLKILSTHTITLDVYIYLNGTQVKILGSIYVPKITLLTEADTYLNLYYETDGNDTAGDLFMRRIAITPSGLTSGSQETTYRRVHGEDFADNLVEWLLNYILNINSSLTGNLGGKSKQALHGEDLIRSFSASGDIVNPTWSLTIGMEELTHIGNLFEDMTLNIKGKTVTYSESGISYSKKSLYSIDGGLKIKFIGLNVASATIRKLNVENISSSSVYSDGWGSSSHKATIYQSYKKSQTLWITSYSIVTGTMIPSSAFANATYGKNNSNSSYRNCAYYSRPNVLA